MCAICATYACQLCMHVSYHRHVSRQTAPSGCIPHHTPTLILQGQSAPKTGQLRRIKPPTFDVLTRASDGAKLCLQADLPDKPVELCIGCASRQQAHIDEGMKTKQAWEGWPQKADSTLRSSQAVPHPSTNRALRRLTSEVRKDPVHSTRYGRQRGLWRHTGIDSARAPCQPHS